MRLRLEMAVARTAGHLSRLTGRGGGTTLPGKLLTRVDHGALRELAGRLQHGVALVSATNGKTTTTAMAAAILRGRRALVHNRAGANLVSGIASALLELGDADLGLFEVDEGAFLQVVDETAPRAVCLGNLFRDQLDRYGELELVADRWRQAVGRLDVSASVVVNVDDPVLATLTEGRERTVRFGLDDPAVARERLPHAADSKYCLSCGAPYDYAAAYVGHLGAWRCTSCGLGRPPLDVAARNIQLGSLERVSFDLETQVGTSRVTLALPGLYNVYNAVAAASLALALGNTLDEIASGLTQFRPAFGRFERIPVSEQTVLMLLIKNPAGANEAVRTLVDGGPPSVAVIALNDDIADGRDVSWIWDVDFEPLLPTLDRLIASGSRAEELALRFKYGGLDESRIEVVGDLAAALDRGLASAPAGGELAVLPTYTAMLALRRIVASRGLVQPYWKEHEERASRRTG